MYLLPRDKLEEDKEFDVVGDLSELHAKPLVEQPTNQNGGTTSHQEGEGFNLYSQILEFLWSSWNDGHFHCFTCIVNLIGIIRSKSLQTYLKSINVHVWTN